MIAVVSCLPQLVFQGCVLTFISGMILLMEGSLLLKLFRGEPLSGPIRRGGIGSDSDSSSGFSSESSEDDFSGGGGDSGGGGASGSW